MKLLVLAVIAGCSKSPPPPAPAPAVVVADAVEIDAAKLVSATQLVTAIVPDWTSTHAELRLWQRDGAAWKLVMGPWQGVVGTSGTAWGIGLHGSGAPAGRSGPTKREGDGKSPAGLFGFRKSYGYAAKANSPLGYQPVDASWKCVDDPKSAHYTQIFDAKQTAKDWSSAEDMRRKDALYTWVVDVAHNPGAQADGGSCIFLHVWRGPDSATVGCTAMEEPVLASLVERLQPGAAYVLLPEAEYEALAPAWGLP